MSSKRAIRRRACTGKTRHASFVAANAAMHALLRAHGSDGRMQVYRCRFCCGFHFGHSNSRPEQRQSRRLHALMEAL